MNQESKRAMAYLLVLAVSIFGVYRITESSNARSEQAARESNARFIQAALGNCENTKQDRIDNARAATAQADYLERVLAASSVKSDVKAAATKALKLWSESANQQRRRLYDCRTLVYQHKRVIDRDALLEAQGEL